MNGWHIEPYQHSTRDVVWERDDAAMRLRIYRDHYENPDEVHLSFYRYPRRPCTPHQAAVDPWAPFSPGIQVLKQIADPATIDALVTNILINTEVYLVESVL